MQDNDMKHGNRGATLTVVGLTSDSKGEGGLKHFFLSNTFFNYQKSGGAVALQAPPLRGP